MARIRTVKPEVCLHDGLFELEQETGLPIRFAYIGLWTQADREGRFRWQPRKLKVQLLPYDELDFGDVLNALERGGFIIRYCLKGDPGNVYGCIPSFSRHQVINNREKPSDIPDPYASDCEITTSTRAPRVPHACPTESQVCAGEGKGREGKGRGKERKGESPQAALGSGADAKNDDGKPSEKKTKSQAFTLEILTFPPELDSPPCREAMANWIEHRRSIGEAIKTVKAAEFTLTKWARAGPAAFIEAVEHSVASGYQGLFSPNGGQRGKQQAAGPGQRYSPGNRLGDW